MGKTYVIAGAGFRGFCDAVQLLKQPGSTVHIVEPAPFFGGIAYSRKVKGFYVDKGVHVFDSIPPALGEIVKEIMDGQTCDFNFTSASAFNRTLTEGFSLPDLSSLDETKKSQIIRELVALAAKEDTSSKAANLLELFHARYGKTAGNIFGDIFKKVYSVDANQAQPDAISKTSLGRLKFLDDYEMQVLKSHPWLDTVLAARRKTMDNISGDLVSLYPNTGEAMLGWCERAVGWLEAKGCKVHLGEKITNITSKTGGIDVQTDKQTIAADKLVWSNDNVSALANALGFSYDVSAYQSGTPMAFMTMITKADSISDLTYLQNFDPDGTTYRTAAAGIFSNQVREDGSSFITCECPTTTDSDLWNNPENYVEKVWQECQDLKVIKAGSELLDHDIVKIPQTFKVAKLGYSEKIAEFESILASKNPRVVLQNVVPFFRRDVYLNSLNIDRIAA
jgi:protoporphyrinogen oxidase